MEDNANDAADPDPAGELLREVVGEGSVDPAHVGQDLNNHAHRSPVGCAGRDGLRKGRPLGWGPKGARAGQSASLGPVPA